MNQYLNVLARQNEIKVKIELLVRKTTSELRYFCLLEKNPIDSQPKSFELGTKSTFLRPGIILLNLRHEFAYEHSELGDSVCHRLVQELVLDSRIYAGCVVKAGGQDAQLLHKLQTLFRRVATVGESLEKLISQVRESKDVANGQAHFEYPGSKEMTRLGAHRVSVASNAYMLLVTMSW